MFLFSPLTQNFAEPLVTAVTAASQLQYVTTSFAVETVDTFIYLLFVKTTQSQSLQIAIL